MAIARVQDEWPDLMLILSANGREIGYCRLNARNFLFPPKDRRISTSNQCLKKNNFIFKVIYRNKDYFFPSNYILREKLVNIFNNCNESR